jgi:hypothetical protein
MCGKTPPLDFSKYKNLIQKTKPTPLRVKKIKHVFTNLFVINKIKFYPINHLYVGQQHRSAAINKKKPLI